MNLRFRVLVLLCVVAILYLATHSHAAENVARPNIVIILVDDLRSDDIGCAGHPFVRTPNIDRIAREGARFRNAFCTTPLCSPSRASLLTGLHTRHHGILDNTNRSKASHDLQTFPLLLQQEGFETAYIGKWHMGNDDTARPGFNHWVSVKGQGTSFNPVLNVDGLRSKFTGYTTDVLNEMAVAYIRREHDKPFCLYLAHKGLHPELVQFDDGSISDPSAAKFLPAKRHANLYENEAIPRRLNVTDPLVGKPALCRMIENLPPLGCGTGTSDETIRYRLRMLASIDDGVGQLFTALSETEQLDNTVLVLLSDHGYWYGEHGLSVERRLAYDEALRIPLLVRYPPIIQPGSVIDEPALSIDLAPTLIELADVKTKPRMDGMSLVPLLAGEHPNDWRTRFLVEYNTDTVFPRVLNMGYRALRTQRWKYIRYNELDEMDELYDLKNDPYEMRNLIREPKTQSVLSDLNSQLDELLKD